MVLTIDAQPSLSAADLQRIEAGLAVRFPKHIDQGAAALQRALAGMSTARPGPSPKRSLIAQV